MTTQGGPRDTLLVSYLSLRKAIGIIGISLPFVLAFGLMVLQQRPGIEGSISAYYHTPMRDVFVGALCAIGVFLWSYRGYDRRDAIAGNLACVFAVGVALFPTTPPLATTAQKIVGGFHYGFAAAFFLTLAYFCLALFTETDKAKAPTPKKLQRNRVYRVCGNTIITAIGLIGVLALAPDSWPIKSYDPVFWLESAAVVAFGVSWLTKGEGILGDERVPAVRAAAGTTSIPLNS